MIRSTDQRWEGMIIMTYCGNWPLHRWSTVRFGEPTARGEEVESLNFLSGGSPNADHQGKGNSIGFIAPTGRAGKLHTPPQKTNVADFSKAIVEVGAVSSCGHEGYDFAHLTR